MRDALRALGAQLHATSQMAWQNRLALDMLVVEKGGVCVMFGDSCCTFIPNNTDSDGSFTLALSKLETLAQELKENAGTDDWMINWFDSMISKWKSVILTAVSALILTLAVFSLVGCCIIPCI